MDGPNSSTLSPLAVFFPLPFHIFVLVGLAILGWATNLHGLDVAGIDVIGAMDLRTDVAHPLPAHHSPRQSWNLSVHYYPLYRICMVYCLLGFVSWAAYRHATHGDLVLMDEFGYIPGITALLALGILLCPYNVLHKIERRKFLHAIGRCMFSSSDSPVYFSDVILADILTSFSQVLGDVWLSLWMLIPGNSILIPPAESGLLRWILPTVMSLPYMIRLRQCIIEYGHQGRTCRRPLYNALKYATAFPTIYLAAAQHVVEEELVKEQGLKAIGTSWHGEHHLFRLWLLAATVNSLYSFWWDVTNDWGLNLLKSHSIRHFVLPQLHTSALSATEDLDDARLSSSGVYRLVADFSAHRHHSYRSRLRSTLLFPLPVYLAMVLLNLMLRVVWLVKPFGLVVAKSHVDLASFFLQIGELIRRWLWVFIRVEWEMIKKEQGHLKVPGDGEEPEYEHLLTAEVQ